jgi:chromate transporter
MNHPSGSNRLKEVVLLFLKLGTTAFGGPAAHVAMMHNEVVEKHKWLSEEEFLDLLGATNLIPGPNSTEMSIHLSFKRAGWPGLILGGASFILPAMLIVGILAWVYVQFGTLPQADWLLYGVKPVMIAVILNALLLLGRKALSGPFPLALAVVSAVMSLFGLNPLLALLIAGAAAILAGAIRGDYRIKGGNLSTWFLPLGSAAWQTMIQSFDLRTLFLTFLKIGSVLYGSGYVLLAFLRADLVVGLGWLTDQQLVDAVAIGQLTPGPVFTTATFIGYVLGGVPGALLATLGIFLPSFIFVALSSRLIPHMRRSKPVGNFLDGVNAASLGLMAAVTWDLGRASLTDLLAGVIALSSFILLTRFKLNTTWLIVGGALIGVLTAALR